MNDAVPQAAPGQPRPQEAGPQPPPEDGPAPPAPLDVPRTPTGHPEVDAQVERLADADHLTTDGHVEVYEDVHRGLRDALTALDTRPGPPVPTPRPGTTPPRGPSGLVPDPPHEHRS